MAQVIIRNLDDHVVENFKLKAELKGHSLEQELRELLTGAAALSPEERTALVRRVRIEPIPGVPRSDSTALIRADRDRDT